MSVPLVPHRQKKVGENCPILYRNNIGEEKPTFLREELCLHSDERPVVGEPTTGFTSHPQPVTGLPGCSVKNQ